MTKYKKTGAFTFESNNPWTVEGYTGRDLTSQIDYVDEAVRAGILNIDTDGWLAHVDIHKSALRGNGIGSAQIIKFEEFCKGENLRRVVFAVEHESKDWQTDWENHCRDDLGYTLVPTSRIMFAYKDL